HLERPRGFPDGARSSARLHLRRPGGRLVQSRRVATLFHRPTSLRHRPSASGSAGLHFSRSPVSPNPIPSSPGTGGSLPANLTAQNYVLRRGGPASRPNWKRSLSASPERPPAGYTTASSEPWPILAAPFPIRRWATSFADTGSSRHPSGARIPPGRISSPVTGVARIHRTSSY